MSRELNRQRMKLDKKKLVEQMELQDERISKLMIIAQNERETAIAQTKNALALALQNMTPIAMEVIKEQFNASESEAKKFESAFYERFRQHLDKMAIDTPVQLEQNQNAQS